MSLSAGTRLGPYEILALIGAGGMGEVYKARDTRLDRVVAVKICAEQFSERFEREARAVAALNHPNICALYDVGTNYLVMEYIEGPTLAGMILGTAGYMSPEQARGVPVDKRADIWAYGVVLYEMLTGREMFSGETVSDALAAVLKTEVDWSALPAETPAPIRRLLRRC